MKHVMLILLLAFGILLSGCSENRPVDPDGTDAVGSENPSTGDQAEQPQEEPQEEEPQEEESPQALTPEEVANLVLLQLKNQDMQSLAPYVHPTKGVRFSPYGYVHLDTDLIFTAQQFEQLMGDPTIYHWGTLDGSGDPIDMSFSQYYERFVYDRDYANAEQTSVNQRLGHGNTIDNSTDVYPNATIVEYHFSGFDPQYNGMDWRSLRIVLEEESGQWFVVGIIHDEWTI